MHKLQRRFDQIISQLEFKQGKDEDECEFMAETGDIYRLLDWVLKAASLEQKLKADKGKKDKSS